MNSRMKTNTVYSSKQGVKQANQHMHSNKEYEMQSRKFGGNIEKWNNSYLTMEISSSCLLPLVH